MKALLCLLAICTCSCLTQSFAQSVPQSVPPNVPPNVPQSGVAPPQQQPGIPRDAAPLVHPRPVVIKPKPTASAEGAPGGTGATALPARPRPATAANGSAATTRAATPSAAKPAAPVRTVPPGTAPVPFNRTTVVLDASHGGIDGGSRITDTLQEKDVDLAFAFRLRSLLTARGFTVLLTRDSDTANPADSATPLTLDDRAGFANHLHPVACLLLHSTGSGKGVHLYSSELSPLPLQPAVVPWLTAQASWVNTSRALQRELGTALTRAEVPLVMSHASIRPLDSLTCPALVLELAPGGSDKENVNDAGYQQRIANAIASAMVFWQTQAQPPARQLPASAVSTAPASAPPVSGGQP